MKVGNPPLHRHRIGALIGGAFTALWTLILFRTVQQHGNWVPWAVGLATWLAAFVIGTLRYNRVKALNADPEATDERLRAVEARAGRTAFQAQSFLLLITIILLSYWGRGAGAFPLGLTEILTVIVVFGSAVYIFAYYWYRYRV